MATDFQEKVFDVLSSIGCTRVRISKSEKSVNYIKRYVGGWRAVIYFFCHINFLIKVSFVILLSFGAFEPVVEFFDWIAILLWFLIIVMILTSERLFYKIHPFFEILCAGWKIQQELYLKLNRDEDFKAGLRQSAKSRVILQVWIAVVGSAAMLFQFLAAPKYCVFTYSVIEADTLLLYIIFGAHELLFIFHGWQFYGGIIYVSSCFGAEMNHCLSTLKEALITARITKQRTTYSSTESELVNVLEEDGNFVRAKRKASGSKYHSNKVESLIMEYRKWIIFSDRLNSYASYNFLVIHVLAYCQMVSDVFVMIQLLRMPETDIVSIIFFAEDAGVCMYMLFKVFKSMSFVSAASQDFLHEFQVYLRSQHLNSTERKILKQTLKSLRTVSMRIGPSDIGPDMVGNAMMTLMNYYVCVAMW